MGLILPKPVISKVVERCGSELVAGAVCSINGFRTTMEDDHVLMVGGDRMLFGVFDGHSNDKCSAYIAVHLPTRINAQPLPIPDAALEKICLDLDEQFLEDVGDGGTTGTFALIEPPKGGKATYGVTVCNVGDSRVLHVRGGEVLFATADHKPANPQERQRIERCGGTVRMNRVDGDLAVSRAFGDGSFKRNRNDPKNQKVIAVPDITRFNAEPGDALVIACDGVFEGSFTNDDVAQFVWKLLHPTPAPPGPIDLGSVGARVCDQAMRRGSKDNITCMVIHFVNGVEALRAYGKKSFVPGPPYPKSNDACRNSYTRMANMAGVSLAEALQQRYALLQAQLSGNLEKLPPLMSVAYEMSDEVDIENEKAFFGSGPPPGQEKAWFQNLADPYGER